MDPLIDPQTVKQAAPGLLGSASAVFITRGPWLVRLGMVLPGAALSWYAAAYVARFTDMPEGLAGYVVGLCGMSVMAKVIATWESLALGDLVMGLIRRWTGADKAPPPPPPAPPPAGG